MHPGHWMGWHFETFPSLMGVEFRDKARTKAHAKFRILYEGGTIELTKEAGRWTAGGLVSQWEE